MQLGLQKMAGPQRSSCVLLEVPCSRSVLVLPHAILALPSGGAFSALNGTWLQGEPAGCVALKALASLAGKG